MFIFNYCIVIYCLARLIKKKLLNSIKICKNETANYTLINFPLSCNLSFFPSQILVRYWGAKGGVKYVYKTCKGF